MHSFWTGYKFCFFVSYATVTIVSKNGTIICDAWLHASMNPAILVDPPIQDVNIAHF